MPLTPDEAYLAEHCYGYGCWSACYWFIGPEQGMGDEAVAARARAFHETSHGGLSDCRAFHLMIGEKRWYDPEAKFQKTWNYQISLLNGYLGKSNSPDARRNYQNNDLGRTEGATCILELRGLSSRTSKESKDQREYIPSRAKHILKMIELHHPVFVVFYGTADQAHWESIAACGLRLDDVTSHAGTMFSFLPHPNARKHFARTHADWVIIGEKLRAKRERLGLLDRCVSN